MRPKSLRADTITHNHHRERKVQFLQLLVHALKNGMLQEQEVYAELLGLAKDKRDALVQNDVEQLGEILKAEEIAMKRVRELNTMQTGTLSKIAEDCALTELPTISRVIELLPSEAEKQKLRTVQQSFQSLIRDLKNQNEQNQKLLETQIQYNGIFLELFTQNEPVGNLYANTGYVSDDPTPRRGFINREA